jgi:hypothetical protein
MRPSYASDAAHEGSNRNNMGATPASSRKSSLSEGGNAVSYTPSMAQRLNDVNIDSRQHLPSSKRNRTSSETGSLRDSDIYANDERVIPGVDAAMDSLFRELVAQKHSSDAVMPSSMMTNPTSSKVKTPSYPGSMASSSRNGSVVGAENSAFREHRDKVEMHSVASSVRSQSIHSVASGSHANDNGNIALGMTDHYSYGDVRNGTDGSVVPEPVRRHCFKPHHTAKDIGLIRAPSFDHRLDIGGGIEMGRNNHNLPHPSRSGHANHHLLPDMGIGMHHPQQHASAAASSRKNSSQASASTGRLSSLSEQQPLMSAHSGTGHSTPVRLISPTLEKKGSSLQSSHPPREHPTLRPTESVVMQAKEIHMHSRDRARQVVENESRRAHDFRHRMERESERVYSVAPPGDEHSPHDISTYSLLDNVLDHDAINGLTYRRELGPRSPEVGPPQFLLSAAAPMTEHHKSSGDYRIQDEINSKLEALENSTFAARPVYLSSSHPLQVEAPENVSPSLKVTDQTLFTLDDLRTERNVLTQRLKELARNESALLERKQLLTAKEDWNALQNAAILDGSPKEPDLTAGSTGYKSAASDRYSQLRRAQRESGEKSQHSPSAGPASPGGPKPQKHWNERLHSMDMNLPLSQLAPPVFGRKSEEKSSSEPTATPPAEATAVGGISPVPSARKSRNDSSPATYTDGPRESSPMEPSPNAQMDTMRQEVDSLRQELVELKELEHQVEQGSAAGEERESGRRSGKDASGENLSVSPMSSISPPSEGETRKTQKAAVSLGNFFESPALRKYMERAAAQEEEIAQLREKRRQIAANSKV